MKAPRLPLRLIAMVLCLLAVAGKGDEPMTAAESMTCAQKSGAAMELYTRLCPYVADAAAPDAPLSAVRLNDREVYCEWRTCTVLFRSKACAPDDAPVGVTPSCPERSIQFTLDPLASSTFECPLATSPEDCCTTQIEVAKKACNSDRNLPKEVPSPEFISCCKASGKPGKK